MVIDTERFGEVEISDEKVIKFPLGLPGFEELKKFVILEMNESKPLYWLQSATNKHISLPVIIPFEFIDEYIIDIRDYELSEIMIEDAKDLFILNVVVIPSDIKEMTTNLAAPIIINAAKGLGKQIIIDAKEMPIRFPIYDLIMTKLKGGEADAGTIEEEG